MAKKSKSVEPTTTMADGVPAQAPEPEPVPTPEPQAVADPEPAAATDPLLLELRAAYYEARDVVTVCRALRVSPIVRARAERLFAAIEALTRTL